MCSKYRTPSQTAVKMQHQIFEALTGALPGGFNFDVSIVDLVGDDFIYITLRPTDYEINGVRGQHPSKVSIWLDVQKMRLHPSAIGRDGDQAYLEINTDDPYLAFESVAIPFHAPNDNEVAVLAGVRLFAKYYLRTMKKYASRLRFSEHYSEGARLYLGLDEPTEQKPAFDLDEVRVLAQTVENVRREYEKLDSALRGIVDAASRTDSELQKLLDIVPTSLTRFSLVEEQIKRANQ